ncbi:MAG: TrbG/VirB9 family P-type conjugative transfer protein [Tsuneonella sp.]
MIRAGIPALAALALAAPALADDPRLVETLYDPAKVVRIEGKTSVQATIAFAEDEHIENVAIGDSQSWQVTPNKRANLLFVKPLGANATTNMTVVTDRHTYLFDLVASPHAKPLYVLRFTYPKEPEGAKPQLADAGAPNAVEAAAASDPYAVVDPAALNFAWAGKGERKLLPSRTYDDGEATFLAWPAGEPVPAILIKDAAGAEGPVNFTVRGDVVVVDGVPREIVLRSGRDSATLTNNGPLPAPRPSALAQSDSSPKRENQ